MNKRIEELSLQCIRYKLIAEGARSDFDYKKFAELIVRECAKTLDDKLANPNGASMAYCDGSDLLEHFGVEE